MCQKNVQEPCPKLTQQYSTGWLENHWKAYLHAVSMMSSGEAQRISNRLLSNRFDRHSRLEKIDASIGNLPDEEHRVDISSF